MFDKKTRAVLNYLESQCADGVYKVFEKDDVISAVKLRRELSRGDFDGIINFLEQKELAIVKYRDEEQVCVALTPKAQAALAEDRRDMQYAEKPSFDKKIYFIVGLVAFIGALLGAVVGKLLGF